MRQILVSDIWGRTPQFEQLALELNQNSKQDPIIIDPYGGVDMSFADEESAYKYFVQHVGIKKYAEILSSQISIQTEFVSLIGFSAGASAIWHVANESAFDNVSSAVCFYGAQIRRNLDFCPNFPIHFIFPVTEPHFSVKEVISKLKTKQSTTIEQSSYQHGFMNRLSNNFDEEGYREYVNKLNIS